MKHILVILAVIFSVFGCAADETENQSSSRSTDLRKSAGKSTLWGVFQQRESKQNRNSKIGHRQTPGPHEKRLNHQVLKSGEFGQTAKANRKQTKSAQNKKVKSIATAKKFTPRTLWRFASHGGGAFQQINDGWIEQTPQGRKKYFEVARTDKHVELALIRGGRRLRLTNDRLWVWSRKKFQPAFPGHWYDKRGNPMPKPRSEATRLTKGPVALRFVGLDQLELTKTKGLVDLRRTFTFEMWFRASGQANVHWLAGNSISRTGWSLWWRHAGKGESLITVGVQNGNRLLQGRAAAKKTNTWRHVALCGDEKDVRIYVDGQRVCQIDSAWLCETAVPSRLNVHLGSNDFEDRLNGKTLSGDIRALRISSICRYSADFEPPQILRNDATTQVLMDFSKAGRGQIRDLSGNGHHGTIKGASWVVVEKLTR